MKNQAIKEYKSKLIHELIYRRKAISILAEHLKCDEHDLFYSYQKGKIPESGTIDNKIYYFFHGLGCTVKNEQEKWKVDLEFGPHGYAAAFDKYTICHIFNKSQKECDALIDELVRANIIQLIDDDLHRFVKTNRNHNLWSSIEEEIDASVADRYMIIEA